MAIRIKKKKYNQSELEREIQMRINVALWAYAYEVRGYSIVSDGKYDAVCREIDIDFPTGNKKLDKWFKKEFGPDTGSWIGGHPEFEKIHALYERLKDSDKEHEKKEWPDHPRNYAVYT